MNEYSLSDFLSQTSISELDRIVSNSKSPMEGNCLYQHHREFILHLNNKEALRKNLFSLCRFASSILEIGFNAGHSCALYLYSNPEIEVVSFDTCEHTYTEECAKYMATIGNVTLFKGDSGLTIPGYNPARVFDLIHVDGGHSDEQSFTDIINCKRLSNEKTILIVDDAPLGGISKNLEHLCSSNTLIEVNYEIEGLIKTRQHRLFRYQ